MARTLLRRLILVSGVASSFACASPLAPPPDHDRRVASAEQGLAEDARIRARGAEIEAARARERGPAVVDEIELRLGDNLLDEHRFRVTTRLPLRRPAEVRSQRDVLRAETEIAVIRLEEVSLAVRAEHCFPSVEALARRAEAEIYGRYGERQQRLLAWSEEWRRSGLIDELQATRFELEARTRLATRAPPAVPELAAVLPVLPALPVVAPEAGAGGALVRDPERLREIVRQHHPSVALRAASAERYRALAERARARSRPWLDFVDLSFEQRTNSEQERGVGGKLAFQVPLGGRPRADVGRYEQLVSKEKIDAEALVDEQERASLRALVELRHFEARGEEWRRLEALADRAEAVADRWWNERLAKPSSVADLVDEAYSARSAVLEARERAGLAGCTLLSLTGVGLESWPRE